MLDGSEPELDSEDNWLILIASRRKADGDIVRCVLTESRSHLYNSTLSCEYIFEDAECCGDTRLSDTNRY